MNDQLISTVPIRLPTTKVGDPQYVCELTDALLTAATEASASDLHLVPGDDELRCLARIDGVLQPIVSLPAGLTPNVIARLKVLAELLTYRTDVPQEGRLKWDGSGTSGSTMRNQAGANATKPEMRLSTFPTLNGEKAVVRLFVGSGKYRALGELGLAEEPLTAIRQLLGRTSGVLLLTGPAGSGKTTLAYALLRELLREHGVSRSLVSLEDPIEAVLAGVTQSAVNTPAGFTYARGLRSLLRQDPDVVFVGEIRDRETAETVFQASLTGHLVVTTFHAGSAAEAVNRLADMGIEPYVLRTGLAGLVGQRLIRPLCHCARDSVDPADQMGLSTGRVRVPVGCPDCRNTGYQSRIPLAEVLDPDHQPIASAILNRQDGPSIERVSVQAGMRTLKWAAIDAAREGLTSPVEIRRVFGLGLSGREYASHFETAEMAAAAQLSTDRSTHPIATNKLAVSGNERAALAPAGVTTWT